MQREFDASNSVLAVLRRSDRARTSSASTSATSPSRAGVALHHALACRAATTGSRRSISSAIFKSGRSSRGRRATWCRDRHYTMGARSQAAVGPRRSKTGRSNRDASSSPSIPRCSVARIRTSTSSIAASSRHCATRYPTRSGPRACSCTACSSARNRRTPTDRASESRAIPAAASDLRSAARGRRLLPRSSQLWIALVRPLVESNERLVVAYNVRLHGRDTVWTTTGGTPDDRFVPTRPQIANLVWEPNLSPSSPAFRREIRSVYRIAGEELVRNTTQVRVVTGSGQLEHPIVGSDATFLQMLGLSQSMNPAEFDYNNRIWPRLGDALNLGIGAIDARSVQTAGVARVIRDQFLVFRRFGRSPSAAPRAAGWWCPATRRTSCSTRRRASICSRRSIRRRSIAFVCNTRRRSTTSQARSRSARRRCVRVRSASCSTNEC